MAVAAAAAAAFAACSSTPTHPATSPKPVAATAGPYGTGAVHIALITPGAPNASDSTFRADQAGLYDASQFSDATFYPAGYHWKVDSRFAPTAVTAVQARVDPQAGWFVDLTFSAAGGTVFRDDAQAAAAAGLASPLNRLAVFVGPRVVWAPTVVSLPAGSDVSMSMPSQGDAFAVAEHVQIHPRG